MASSPDEAAAAASDTAGRPAASSKRRGRPPIKLDWAAVKPFLGIPQPEAAKALGISLTSLKLVCRKQGLTKWPYRRVHQAAGRSTAADAGSSDKEAADAAARAHTTPAGLSPLLVAAVRAQAAQAQAEVEAQTSRMAESRHMAAPLAVPPNLSLGSLWVGAPTLSALAGNCGHSVHDSRVTMHNSLVPRGSSR